MVFLGINETKFSFFCYLASFFEFGCDGTAIATNVYLEFGGGGYTKRNTIPYVLSSDYTCGILYSNKD